MTAFSHIMPGYRLTAGVGFKPDHFEAAYACGAPGMWYEIHAENYMQSGGPRLAMLDTLCTRHAISVHGVGLSLASSESPDALHLQRLKAVVERSRAALVSEHLAWSAWRGHCVPDLLPFPRTQESLQLIARNIDITQSTLRRKILIENPSMYVSLAHDYDEVEFLTELVTRTGCGLLLDVNNVHVSAHNLGYDAHEYLRRIPASAVEEIHLAGHAHDETQGSTLLIDTHGCAVDEAVWTLYAEFIERIGPRPTLLERDDNIPPFAELMQERTHAARLMSQFDLEPRYVCAG